MALSSIAAALGIVEKVSRGFDWVRERVKASKDADLKERINGLYDDFLDLKANISSLADENRELQRKLVLQAEKSVKPEIRQIGKSIYYYVGDQGPYCQPCYDDKGKLIHLTPAEQNSGGTCRRCRVCRQVFYEETKSEQAVRVVRGAPWVTDY